MSIPVGSLKSASLLVCCYYLLFIFRWKICHKFAQCFLIKTRGACCKTINATFLWFVSVERDLKSFVLQFKQRWLSKLLISTLHWQRNESNGGESKNKWFKFNDTVVEPFTMNEESLEAECFCGTYKANGYDTGKLSGIVLVKLFEASLQSLGYFMDPKGSLIFYDGNRSLRSKSIFSIKFTSTKTWNSLEFKFECKFKIFIY